MEFAQVLSTLEEQPAPAVEVPVLLELDAVHRLRTLEAEFEKRQHSPGDAISDRTVGDVADDIAALYEQHEPVVFRFVPLSPRAWSDLAAKHPPVKGQPGDVNPATFWPEAMAASCEQPEGATAEKFQALFESNKVTNGTWQRLVNGCRAANEGVFDLRPTPTVSAALRARARRSATAPSEGSPGPSS